jgi:ABC-2 type transport system permease protein
MPWPAQWVGQALPLTHFLRVVRGIALKNVGFSELTSEISWLCGLLVLLVSLTSLRFSKKLA